MSMQNMKWNHAYLESYVSIVMQPKDLRFINEWQALNVIPIFRESVFERCIVYACKIKHNA